MTSKNARSNYFEKHFKPCVAGSSPAGASCSVAQSVEQRINPTHSDNNTMSP